MAEVRWKEEREEIIELVYRIQADFGGNLPEREARKLYVWAADAIKRARKIRWLVANGSPPILSVTKKGSKALDMALASRDVDVPAPHWFGGSIVSVQSETGPVLPAQSYKPYEELREWAQKQGLLTQQDIDRIANFPRKELPVAEEYAMLNELSFPGTRGFAVALQFADSHPFGGGSLDPAGYEGPYQVTVTLTRRGAPDIPSAYVTDAYMMEGDSHLYLPEIRREDGAEAVMLLEYGNLDGSTTQFQLLANRQGRLGQISTVFRAENADDARRKAYRILNPFLCDLSFRYDIPMDVLQTNVAEIATYRLGGTKQDDFQEKVFDPDSFFGPGLNYAQLPNYEFFMRLYREGTNSSSVDYGFLCFFRIAEGILETRRKQTMEREGKTPDQVPRSSVFLQDEIIGGGEAETFPSGLQNKSLWEAYKELDSQRTKVAHAFLHSEDPLAGHADIIADRLEDEEQAGTRRAQARYLARRMLLSEFWRSGDEQ